ncbi:MAG TPA: hypothetical protein VHE12_09645 [bacterium]|nr:hypothetical protein [bacterium]
MQDQFPHLDPIPLPAPVWLFKALHHLTLSLHFSFLAMLLGGLVLGILWNLIGQATRKKAPLFASGLVANRLPIITTYVINLGVPPLLFVQVLYGRAIYTSTILIGVYWISVVFAVMGAYWVLYRMASRAEAGKSWWLLGIGALVLLAYVGRVYSMASTLMLKPEVWPGMYDASPSGVNLPPHDPTLLPRLLMVLVGSLGFGSLGTTLYTAKGNLSEEVKLYIRQGAAQVALAALLVLLVIGTWAFRSQPDFVQAGLRASAFYGPFLYLWPACVALSLLAALWLLVSPKGWNWGRILAVTLPPFLSIASFEILRDGVRDLTLAQAGFDVWASPVNTNWLVVGLFLGLLVIGVGFMVWVLAVMRRALPREEHYA